MGGSNGILEMVTGRLRLGEVGAAIGCRGKIAALITVRAAVNLLIQQAPTLLQAPEVRAGVEFVRR